MGFPLSWRRQKRRKIPLVAMFHRGRRQGPPHSLELRSSGSALGTCLGGRDKSYDLGGHGPPRNGEGGDCPHGVLGGGNHPPPRGDGHPLRNHRQWSRLHCFCSRKCRGTH